MLTIVLFAGGLFVGMLLCLELGQHIGRLQIARRGGASTGFGPLEGAIFGLMGLLLAFTFSGAAARFDHRRDLVVEEANDIGTAYLRIDLLLPASQPPLRDAFRRYLDSRILAYRKLPDIAAAKAELARADGMQSEIWRLAVAACQEAGTTPSFTLLLPAINAMIDITNTRTASTAMHPPGAIYALLALLVLACSGLAGYGMAAAKPRSWLHIVAFVAIIATTIYLIVDLEYPRLGFIRVDSFDQLLVDVRNHMN